MCEFDYTEMLPTLTYICMGVLAGVYVHACMSDIECLNVNGSYCDSTYDLSKSTLYTAMNCYLTIVNLSKHV